MNVKTSGRGEMKETERKALCFAAQLMNAYRDEDERECIEALTLHEETITDDLTAMLYGMCLVYQQITGDSAVNILEFTLILNSLAVQSLMEDSTDNV